VLSAVILTESAWYSDDSLMSVPSRAEGMSNTIMATALKGFQIFICKPFRVSIAWFQNPAEPRAWQQLRQLAGLDRPLGDTTQELKAKKK